MSIRCVVREREVALTPEEQVRQQLLQEMVCQLGFPKGLISVEKQVGTRRYDLVCYTQLMTPLLLIECKAGAIDEAAMQQAVGYNATIKAPFFCLVNSLERKTFWLEKEGIQSVPFLPSYQQLNDFFRRN